MTTDPGKPTTLCKRRNEGWVWQLLQHGADANRADSSGTTALHIACERNLVACTKLLLMAGADTSVHTEQGNTALRIAIETNRTCCKAALVAHGAHVHAVDFRGAERSMEVAVAMGGNQFVMNVRFKAAPSEELRAIMWRSPSLRNIVFRGGTVTREEDGLAMRPAVQRGDRVRVCRTDGDWEVAKIVGDHVELHGRSETVPIEDVIFAGPGHLAWQEANAAEARGQSNAMTRLLCRRGYISTRVRSLVSDFL